MESMPCKIANFYLNFVHIIKPPPPWQVEGQTKVDQTSSYGADRMDCHGTRSL
jgi:hypothetical protein